MSNALTARLNSEVNSGDLSEQIIQLYANINAATYAWLKLIAQFDAQHTAQSQGFISTAAWLGYYCGVGATAAREKVRVARALEALPSIDAEFAAGRLSYSKVRALTRVVSPVNEIQLLKVARHATAHQLARVLRDYARVTADPVEVSQTPELTWNTDERGNLVFKGRFPAELGALMMQALQRKAAQIAEHDRSMANQYAEALLALVQTADEPSAKQVSSADRYLVHVELNPVNSGTEPAQLRSGEVLPRSAAERLTCDAALVGHMIDADGEPMDMGRKTRIVSGPLRRALIRRDKGCRFPGCTRVRFVDAHHVHHWVHGGETKLNNLILLCSRHHRYVHEGQFRVHAHHPAQGATQFRFYSAEGAELLPTGDQGLARIQPLPEVTAGTFTGSIDDGIYESPLRPMHPQARPDYHDIACYLANYVPRE